MNEFEIIEKYFAPLSRDGLRDDTAVLKIPPGFDLIVTSDTLNEGVHFPLGEAPEFIAHKALRVNLSDLAAAGARPLSYQLNLAFVQKPDCGWLEKFTGVLAADQALFDIYCSGGDTTSIKGGFSVSITALGLVPSGQALGRGGAKAGDAVVLSGPVGDALIGLEALRGNIITPHADFFALAYRKPLPRLALAEGLRRYAHAAVDISDGLIADLGHVCRASAVTAEIELAKIPFSAQASLLLESGAVSVEALLTGGDDYQLALAVPPENIGFLDFEHYVIGRFVSGSPKVEVLDAGGEVLSFKKGGWQHF
ncbi:MAG: thiamine-phosphate kinase [Alphaproteobacteria bacterium]|nr:thiamine-phosphate kinase [Alphaproteobacteria bacterium]